MLYIPIASSFHRRSFISFILSRKHREVMKESRHPLSRPSSLRGKYNLVARVTFFLFFLSFRLLEAISLSLLLPLRGLDDSIFFQPLHASSSRRHKTTSNIHPLRNTTALLTLHIHNISVTPTPATHAVLLLRVPLGPVVVVLFQELLVVSVGRSTLLFEIRS